NAFHIRTKLEEFGIRGAGALRADIPAVLRRVRALRDDFVAGVLQATEDLGDRNVAGYARLDGPNRLIVGERVIEAEQVILAPGSTPIVPGPWRSLGDRILTSDTLFEQEDLPRRIAVIGLGPLGVEIAQALARLGLEVHGFDAGSTIAGISDEKVAEAAREYIEKEFPIHLGAQVELTEAGSGVEIRWAGESLSVDKVVVAVGRRPNVDGLGLETLGVELDENGLPEIDGRTMRIGSTSVLLAGDAIGERPFLHEAADDGHIAGLNATSDEPIQLRRRTPLTVVFCDPEVVTVGRSAQDLDPRTTVVGETSFAEQGRARIMQENRGLLRVYAARETGRVLGAAMVMPA